MTHFRENKRVLHNWKDPSIALDGVWGNSIGLGAFMEIIQWKVRRKLYDITNNRRHFIARLEHSLGNMVLIVFGFELVV